MWVFLTGARLAQLVEHESLNLRVVGSSPTLGDLVFFFNYISQCLRLLVSRSLVQALGSLVFLTVQISIHCVHSYTYTLIEYCVCVMCRLCCVLAVNMMVYLRLITTSQSVTSMHSAHHGDVKFEELKL